MTAPTLSAEEFLEKLAHQETYGAIVSSGDCSTHEISNAQAQGRFFVSSSGLGFVLRSRQWLDSREEAFVEACADTIEWIEWDANDGFEADQIDRIDQILEEAAGMKGVLAVRNAHLLTAPAFDRILIFLEASKLVTLELYSGQASKIMRPDFLQYLKGC